MKTLVVGKRYEIERLHVGKKSVQRRFEVMEYLGEFGQIYLFRHPIGYKESFMKKDVGIGFVVRAEKKQRRAS